MNSNDSQLDRLLRAAAQSTRPIPAEAPFAVEVRVLAAWRRPADDGRTLILPLARRAFLCACAIMLITAALAIHSFSESQPNELVIVDSVIQLTLMQ